MKRYPRLADDRLAHLLSGLPAVAIEGAKGVGKTVTASALAQDIVALDDPRTAEVVAADPFAIVEGMTTTPALIDEWQLVPPVWDAVRRRVDDMPAPGQFILAGSAMGAATARVHSGAGRIVRMVMRPLAFCERQLAEPTVSLAELMTGDTAPVSGRTRVTLADYAEEILASGLPGIRQLPAEFRDLQLDGYLARVVGRDLPEAGTVVRRPAALRAWMTAYAAATATTASYTTILDAATSGDGDKPTKATIIGYREALERAWILDPLPAWEPHGAALGRLGLAPRHHVADPAFATRLLGLSREQLLRGATPTITVSPGPMLGQLFESLVCLSVRAMAEVAGLRVSHFRTRNGDREIDLIVERPDGAILAIEAKLHATADDDDTKHLRWLRSKLGERVLGTVVVTTGAGAYRRPDGTAVVPLALLGP